MVLVLAVSVLVYVLYRCCQCRYFGSFVVYVLSVDY